MKRTGTIILLLVLGSFLLPGNNVAQAAPKQVSVATINIHELMTESKIGRTTREKILAKNVELQTKYMAEQQKLVGLREEIKKKGSVWTEAVRNDRIRDFQQKELELQIKSDEMTKELQQLEMELMEPIRIELDKVIAEYGKKNGYTLILDSTRAGVLSRNGLLFADVPDISEPIRKELDSRMGNK